MSNVNTTELKRSSGKGQLIHSSLLEISSSESDFPSSKPTPGILLRAVYHHGLQRIMLDLYYESPIIISPGKGEIIECDLDLADSKVRDLLLSIAERCRTQGEELIEHASRLLELASQETLIDEIDQDRIKSKAGYTGSIGLISKDVNVVSVVSSGKEKGKQGRPRVRNEDLLSMLADDDEGEEEGTGTPRVEEEEEEQEEDDNLLDCLLEED